MGRFLELIDARIEYLKSLHVIVDDWISGVPGGSVAPSLHSCNVAISYLKHLRERQSLDESITLVMGPMPRGGVSIEMSLSARSLHVEFNNDGCVEIALVIDNGNFFLEESYATAADADLKITEWTEKFLLLKVNTTKIKPRL